MTAISRAWLRHATLRSILSEQQFDGVIDGGANVGEFAAIVRHVLPGSDLVCIEPHPGCAATLRRQGYRIVEAALWRESGSIMLSQPLPETTSCTTLDVTVPEQGSRWKVAAVRLEDLEIEGQRILVKLDLQGAEPIALEAMGALWDRCSGVLSEVTMGKGGTYETLDHLLRQRGFREFSTLNQLRVKDGQWEADKLWLRHW